MQWEPCVLLVVVADRRACHCAPATSRAHLCRTGDVVRAGVHPEHVVVQDVAIGIQLQHSPQDQRMFMQHRQPVLYSSSFLTCVWTRHSSPCPWHGQLQQGMLMHQPASSVHTQLSHTAELALMHSMFPLPPQRSDVQWQRIAKGSDFGACTQTLCWTMDVLPMTSS